MVLTLQHTCSSKIFIYAPTGESDHEHQNLLYSDTNYRYGRERQDKNDGRVP